MSEQTFSAIEITDEPTSDLHAVNKAYIDKNDGSIEEGEPAGPSINVRRSFRSLFVSWDGLDVVVSGRGYYQVQLALDDTYDPLIDDLKTKTSWTVFDGLDQDTTYYIRVRAVDAAGNTTGWTATFTTSEKVVTDDISNEAITETQIANLAITNAKIANATIDGELKIQGLSVSIDEIKEPVQGFTNHALSTSQTIAAGTEETLVSMNMFFSSWVNTAYIMTTGSCDVKEATATSVSTIAVGRVTIGSGIGQGGFGPSIRGRIMDGPDTSKIDRISITPTFSRTISAPGSSVATTYIGRSNGGSSKQAANISSIAIGMR